MTENEIKASDAFEEYRQLKAVADQTMRMRDAEAAGAAWARFIDLFLPVENRLTLNKVTPLHRRRAS